MKVKKAPEEPEKPVTNSEVVNWLLILLVLLLLFVGIYYLRTKSLTKVPEDAKVDNDYTKEVNLAQPETTIESPKPTTQGAPDSTK